MNSSMHSSASSWPHEHRRLNHLLAALAQADGSPWHQALDYVELTRGQVLQAPGELPRHVYFPTTSVVALHYVLANGASTEVAVVGNEGLVGVSVLISGGSMSSTSTVVIPGHAFRMGTLATQGEFNQCPSARTVLLRYVQALTTQIAQTAVCNRHHSIEQQLCDFLLHSLDRLPGHEVPLTQDLIAVMLGVRRSSVCNAATSLHSAGLIDHARGRITVRDRSALERRACECHAVVKLEYDRLLPQTPAARPVVPHPWQRA